MEITKSNFTERLDDVKEAVEQATFLAIDGEFTGLDIAEYGHTAPFDTPAERYFKLRQGSMDFLLIQFGLCTFKFNEETKSYEARPFNFYIFPRPYTRQAPDRRFLCQSSSIEFLVQQGFDFNKLFREGIPYLIPTQEEMMREALNCKHQAFAKFSSPAFVSPDGAEMGPGKGPIQIPDEQKEFIAGVCDKISAFTESSEENQTLQLAPCNGFQRKLIYQTIRSKFSSVHLETKTGEKKERYIVVTKVASDEELKKKEKDKQNAEVMELEEAVGFSKVLRIIAQSGKLVVGHNMMLDVMHMLNQFCYSLPQDLEEFKSLVSCCLPRLLDTKLMASTHPLKDLIASTTLNQLQQTLEKDPFTPAKVELGEEFKRYENATDKYHEAGFDAYVTGCMFATMSDFIGNYRKSAKAVVAPTAELMEPFINKLFLMRIADIPYLNLRGPDLQPSRDHVFHLTFPREWKSSDINNLFAPYGNIHISWLNDTSAFVSLYKKDNANVVTKALCKTQSIYRLVPYSVHKGVTSAAPAPLPVAAPAPSPAAPVSVSGVKRAAVSSQEDAPLSKKCRSSNDEGPKPAAPDGDEISEAVPKSQAETSSNGAESAPPAEKMFMEPDDW